MYHPFDTNVTWVRSPSRNPVTRILLAIVFGLVAGGTLVASEPDQTVNFGASKQLLVDDFAIAQTQCLERVLPSVRKENGQMPVLLADVPGEQDVRIGFYLTAMKTGSRYQMWYLATSDNVA